MDTDTRWQWQLLRVWRKGRSPSRPLLRGFALVRLRNRTRSPRRRRSGRLPGSFGSAPTARLPSRFHRKTSRPQSPERGALAFRSSWSSHNSDCRRATSQGRWASLLHQQHKPLGALPESSEVPRQDLRGCTRGTMPALFAAIEQAPMHELGRLRCQGPHRGNRAAWRVGLGAEGGRESAVCIGRRADPPISVGG